MADHSQLPGDERTPLLRDTINNDRDENGENDDHLNHQVRIWRLRRWISLIASAFLIVVFIVILILSGGK